MKRLISCWIGLRLCTAFGAAAVDTNAPVLSLQEAEELALKNHPRISVAELRALSAKEVVKEARSAFFPTIAGNVTAVGNADRDDTRIAAGALNNPSIFERAALGLSISQLITDFGRTANLTASSRLHAKAEEQHKEATRAQIRLQVDTAYFAALGAQSVLRVAQQTVTARQLLLDQVSALASNKLKSELDVSFARVAHEEGRLLLSRAENDLKAAFVQLSILLGTREEKTFQLVEEATPTNAPPNVSELVGLALANRPDLLQLRYERDAATKFVKAERALHYPTISAVGAAGRTPVHDDHLIDDYAAAGVNLNVPLFNGFLYSSRQKDAQLRAKAAEENLRDAENTGIRDVRVAWLNFNNAFERAHITAQLLENAKQALALAQARYKVGSSSIVELSQAELNQTTAEIANATARYELLIHRSVLDFDIGRYH
jgi:outer membrane protein